MPGPKLGPAARPTPGRGGRRRPVAGLCAGSRGPPARCRVVARLESLLRRSPVLRVPVLAGPRADRAILPRRTLSESPRVCCVCGIARPAPPRPAAPPWSQRAPQSGMPFCCSGPQRTDRVHAPSQVPSQVRAPRAMSVRSRAPAPRRPARRWSPCCGSRAAQRSCREQAVALQRCHHPSHSRFSSSAASSRRAQRSRVQNQAYQPPSRDSGLCNLSGQGALYGPSGTHPRTLQLSSIRPKTRWGCRRGRGVGRAHAVPRPPPLLRPSAGPQRR
jgi:hypothetical protein